MKFIRTIAFLLILTMVFSLCTFYAEGYSVGESRGEASEIALSESNVGETRDVAPLTSGSYYINNLHNRKFLGNIAYGTGRKLLFTTGQTTSLSSSGCVWQLQYISSGYYYIKNTVTTSSGATATYYLQYTSQNTTSNGFFLLSTLPTNVNYAQWQIVQEGD